jgi:hypothetical protein
MHATVTVRVKNMHMPSCIIFKWQRRLSYLRIVPLLCHFNGLLCYVIPQYNPVRQRIVYHIIIHHNVHVYVAKNSAIRQIKSTKIKICQSN